MKYSILIALLGTLMSAPHAFGQEINLETASSQELASPSEQAVFTRSGATDLAALTMQIQQQVPTCVGLSKSGDSITVHLKEKADAGTVQRIQNLIANHSPKTAAAAQKSSPSNYRTRYSSARTTEEKLDIMAEWLNLKDAGS